MTTPIFTRPAPPTWTGEVLDHRVGEQRLGHLPDLLEHLVGDLTGELELEPLALADVGHPGEAEPRQRAEDGLALGVEDLGLGHHVDDDLGHGTSLDDLAPYVPGGSGPWSLSARRASAPMLETWARYVYAFTEGSKEQKDLLGGKGANLAEMTRLGLPVPPGVHHHHRGLPRLSRHRQASPPGLKGELDEHLTALEKVMGRSLGDPDDPLLVSVRSGAKFSMPGMMETVLDLGLNDESVLGLARASGSERFAFDSYRRLLQMFGATVLGIDADGVRRRAGQAQGRPRRLRGRRPRRRRPARAGRDLPGHHPRAHRPRLPAGPARAGARRGAGRVLVVAHRARGALPPPRADPRRPRHRRQRPGHGLRQPRTGLGLRGVLHPRPRERLRAASTATTSPTPRARTSSPGSATRCRSPTSRRIDKPSYDALLDVMALLERHYRDLCDIEFTIEQRPAVDPADPGRQAHSRGGVPDRPGHGRRGADRRRRGGTPGHRRASSPSCCSPASTRPPTREHLTTGIGASPGATSGRIALSSATAVGLGRASATTSCWCAARPTRTTCPA